MPNELRGNAYVPFFHILHVFKVLARNLGYPDIVYAHPCILYQIYEKIERSLKHRQSYFVTHTVSIALYSLTFSDFFTPCALVAVCQRADGRPRFFNKCRMVIVI